MSAPRPPAPRDARAPKGRRTVRALVVLALVAATGAGFGAACSDGGDGEPGATAIRRPKPKATPSVVVIDVCGLRRVDLAGERLLAGAASFEQATAPAAWSIPSLASTFTGFSPLEAGGVDKPYGSLGAGLLPSVRTLAEVLRDEGYATAAFSSSREVLATSGLDQGFEGAWRACGPGAASVDEAIRWLDARDRTKPCCLFVLIDVASIASTAADDAARWTERATLARTRARALGEHVAKTSPNDTITACLSDHGAGVSEGAAGRPLHGGWLSDERIHVPFELRGPGVPPTAVAGTCTLTDLLPTVLDAMGLPPDGGVEGRSLLPLVAHPEHPGLPAVAQEWRAAQGPDGPVELRLYAVRFGTRKFVATFTPRPAGWTEALYDTAADPGETRPATNPAGGGVDVASVGPAFVDAVERVRGLLSGRRKHLNDEIVGGYIGR